MFNKYTITILLLLLTNISFYGQTPDNLKKPKHEMASEAYFYLLGQEYSLEQINKEFPQLELNVLKAKYSFNSTFSKSKEGIKKYLNEYFDQNEFKKYEDELISEIKKYLANNSFTEESAANFIIEVENRAKGNIASTLLETLLLFQFSDNPHDELKTGFTNLFKTKGHTKSKNTDWQFKIPKSWKAFEGDRPNIIQKFISEYGTGKQAITVMVKDMPIIKGYTITKEDLDELFTEKEMKDMVPDGAIYISFTKMKFDGNIGGMLEYEQTIERLDYKFKFRTVQFSFIRNNKWHILSCNVSTENLDIDLTIEMKKYLILYKLVANSIVVNDQY